MKKKLLSLLIIGGLFAGMGLSAECFAASGHHRDVKNNQHKELRHRPAPKKPAKPAKKAAPKKHQAMKKHQQTRFKAQKQHQKNVKKYQKNNRKNIRNLKKHQNKTPNRRNHRRR